MNVVNILIGLMPMIGWGVFPIMTGKFGGKPVNQIIGATYGTLLSAIVVAVVMQTPLLTGKNFLFTFLSGACWSIAQSLVFYAFGEMGVSKTMPVSTGFQLIGTSLWGVIVLGEWPSVMAKLIGFFSIVLIIIGVFIKSTIPTSSLLINLYFVSSGNLEYSLFLTLSLSCLTDKLFVSVIFI